MTLGERIKEIRGDMSQDVFADVIGVTKSALSMYERNERVPRDEIKVRIAKAAGKTVQAIFFDGIEYK